MKRLGKYDRIPDYAAKATFADGVMRWVSNGSVPPKEHVAEAAARGFVVNVAACDAARDADFKQFMVAYRDRRAQRSPEEIAEERFEMRAAFGEGVEVVDVFSGERMRT